MTVKSISTSKIITINTENNTLYKIEISTFLGTIVFRDTILPLNKCIKIIGLNPGKYIISLSNQDTLIKKNLYIK